MLIIAFLLTGTSTGRAYGRAALLVTDLLSPTTESILTGVTPEPTSETVLIPAGERLIESRYYHPAGDGQRGALILVLGFPSDIDDRPLNQVAQNLARLGIAVLIPRLPHLRNGELELGDVEALVSAFEWLTTRPEIFPDRVGFAGFCVGSSLALLAAENPHIANRVALVNVFGGYYDLRTYIRAIAARSAWYQHQEYPWRPAADTDALMVSNVLYYLDSPEDAALIRAHFSGHTARAPLTPAGEWALAFLSSTDPATVDALLANLPDGYDIRLDAMSPSIDIERLRAKIYIMHDLSDPFVPVVEGRRLLDSIPDRLPVKFAEFTLFEHVRPAPGLNRLEVVGEAVRLISFLAPVMADLD